jgi:hypothetical protein
MRVGRVSQCLTHAGRDFGTLISSSLILVINGAFFSSHFLSFSLFGRGIPIADVNKRYSQLVIDRFSPKNLTCRAKQITTVGRHPGSCYALSKTHMCGSRLFLILCETKAKTNTGMFHKKIVKWYARQRAISAARRRMRRLREGLMFWKK